MPPTDEDLIEDMLAVAQQLGRTPTARDLNEHGEYTRWQHEHVFGSLVHEQILAGLEPNSADGIPDELLLEEFRAIADELGHRPRRRDIEEYSLFSRAVFLERFGGTWDAVCERAGVSSNRE